MKTNRNNTRAFTLAEILVAMAISVVVIASATGFFVETLRGHNLVNQRANQAHDIWSFSQELIYHAGRANQFYLYKSVTQADRDEPADQQLLDTLSSAPDILHPAGDFIVFVYFEIPKPAAQNYHRIKKLVGYYLNAAAGDPGTIKRITIDLSKNLTTGAATLADQVPCYGTVSSVSKTMVEQAMLDNWNSATHATTAEFKLTARGLFVSEVASDTSGAGRLFYIRDKVSVMVAGQLYGTKDTNRPTTTTDTFSFSITPRS